MEYFSARGEDNQLYAIAVPSQSLSPPLPSDSFATVLVVGFTVTLVAVIAVAILIYFKKRKH